MKRLLFFIIPLLVISTFILAKTINADALSRQTRFVVKFKSLTPEKKQNEILARIKYTRKEKLRLKNSFVIESPGKLENLKVLFNKENLLEYIEVDNLAFKVETPNDPMYSSQWGIQKIQADYAWEKSHGLDSVLIAVVDTGIDDSHPDLNGKVVKRANFTDVSDIDGDGHGTHVAGIASAVTNNSIGVAGIGYNTKLMSAKVLDNNGSGYYSWVANGIVWAADNGAKVINLSLGGRSSSTTLRNAIDYAWGKGSIVVAAAGNSNSSRSFYPAYYSSAIAVAAIDQNDNKASFSNYGTWVDVAAPGVSILSTYKGNYDYLSGTSMATPFVAGLASLVFSNDTSLNNAQVRQKIETTSDKILNTGKYWYFGRINACRALDCSYVSTPTPTLTPTITSSPTPTSTPNPTLTPAPTQPEPTPTQSEPTPTSSPSPTPTQPEPTPTPSPTPEKPWWCKYIPNHSSCQ